MTAALLLLAAFVLVVACGIFVAAEFAFLAVDRPTVERLAASGDRQASGVRSSLRRLSTQLSGVQIGITLTNLVIGLLSEPALAALLEGPLRAVGLPESAVPTIAVTIGLIVSTLVTMVLGELVPKNLAIALPLQVARRVQAPVRAFTRAMAWPIRRFNALANALLHRAGLEAREELASARSGEELLAVVHRSAQQGALETGTAALLARSLVFGSRRAHDAMTPRVRMRVVAATAPVEAVIAASVGSGYSRFPVVGADVDDIVGVVHVKDALAVPRPERAATPVSAQMTRPVLVPSSLPIDDLLDRLQERGPQMAIVVDEYGGTDGVVTLEDVVEELFGEVVDEFDPASGAGVVRRDGGWDVPGPLRPDEAGAAIGHRVPSGRWTTVAGLFLTTYERLPAVGDAIELAGLRWTVLEMEQRRIVLLRAEPVDDA